MSCSQRLSCVTMERNMGSRPFHQLLGWAICILSGRDPSVPLWCSKSSAFWSSEPEYTRSPGSSEWRAVMQAAGFLVLPLVISTGLHEDKVPWMHLPELPWHQETGFSQTILLKSPFAPKTIGICSSEINCSCTWLLLWTTPPMFPSFMKAHGFAWL